MAQLLALPYLAASSATAAIIQRCDAAVAPVVLCTTRVTRALWLAAEYCSARYATSITLKDHALQVSVPSRCIVHSAGATTCPPGGASAATVGIYIQPAVHVVQTSPDLAASSATAAIIQRCDVAVTPVVLCTTRVTRALWLAAEYCSARYATSITLKDHALQVSVPSRCIVHSAVATTCPPGGASAATVGIYIQPAVHVVQ
jgi:hypothetical protein